MPAQSETGASSPPAIAASRRSSGGLLRADLRSECDRLAERAVAAGGGLQAVIEATGLHSRDNAFRLVDPAILVRAFDNDIAARASLAARARLRRLVPDPELVKRRAAGEPLRELARAYEIAHTTLSRYFRRPTSAPTRGSHSCGLK